jgi:arylformamidase
MMGSVNAMDELAGRGWIDITRPLSAATPVWPGDQPLTIDQCQEGDVMVSSFATTCHVGSHVDAPLHLEAGAKDVEGLGLSRLIGPAEVIRVAGVRDRIAIGDLPRGWQPSQPRLLIRTDCLPLGMAIGPGIVGLEMELVAWLASHGVELVGTDSPSMDPFSAVELSAHRALAEHDVTWIEGLWLEHVEPGPYFMVALPLRLLGVEAAPLRAVLAPL